MKEIKKGGESLFLKGKHETFIYKTSASPQSYHPPNSKDAGKCFFPLSMSLSGHESEFRGKKR